MNKNSDNFYKLEDYLRLEKSTNEKFEFWNGNIKSVSTANFTHCIILQNLNVEIDSQIYNKGCQSFPSDMRIKVPEYPPYRYPDLTAICGKAETEKIGGIDMLINPQLIIEVLSDSTEAFDRGDKFSYYKSIESFTEYLLVAQHRPHVSHFIKHGDGFWMNLEYNYLSDEIELKSVPCRLSLKAIYRNVSFSDVK